MAPAIDSFDFCIGVCASAAFARMQLALQLASNGVRVFVRDDAVEGFFENLAQLEDGELQHLARGQHMHSWQWRMLFRGAGADIGDGELEFEGAGTQPKVPFEPIQELAIMTERVPTSPACTASTTDAIPIPEPPVPAPIATLVPASDLEREKMPLSAPSSAEPAAVSKMLTGLTGGQHKGTGGSVNTKSRARTRKVPPLKAQPIRRGEGETIEQLYARVIAAERQVAADDRAKKAMRGLRKVTKLEGAARSGA